MLKQKLILYGVVAVLACVTIQAEAGGFPHMIHFPVHHFGAREPSLFDRVFGDADPHFGFWNDFDRAFAAPQFAARQRPVHPHHLLQQQLAQKQQQQQQQLAGDDHGATKQAVDHDLAARLEQLKVQQEKERADQLVRQQEELEALQARYQEQQEQRALEQQKQHEAALKAREDRIAALQQQRAKQIEAEKLRREQIAELREQQRQKLVEQYKAQAAAEEAKRAEQAKLRKEIEAKEAERQRAYREKLLAEHQQREAAKKKAVEDRLRAEEKARQQRMKALKPSVVVEHTADHMLVTAKYIGASARDMKASVIGDKKIHITCKGRLGLLDETVVLPLEVVPSQLSSHFDSERGVLTLKMPKVQVIDLEEQKSKSPTTEMLTDDVELTDLDELDDWNSLETNDNAMEIEWF
eukprot:GFYU01000400.1.p2 GENE.GFYU01000400.1~~GFYU01000400.1.p2  ORF type:complete len:410 (+),score=157.15 GFYU01000400.1:123-1352(+)